MAVKKSPIDRLIDVGIVGVLGGAAVIFINKAMKNSSKTTAENMLMSDPSVQQASRLRSAFNPSGYSWLSSSDGTNTNEVFAVAAEIKDFNAVQKAYVALSKGNSLVDDLRSELSVDEFNRFIAQVTTVKSTAKATASKPSSRTAVLNTTKCPTPPINYKFNGNDVVFGISFPTQLYKEEKGKFIPSTQYRKGDRKIGRIVSRGNFNQVDKNCKLLEQKIMYKVQLENTKDLAWVLEKDIKK